MKGWDILAMSQFDKDSIDLLFSETNKVIKSHQAGKPLDNILKGRVIALIFFEPSSRTFGSFSSAVKRVGGSTIEIHDSKNLSQVKGESFEDTIKTFESYSDGFVIRHHMPGSVQRAAEVAKIPVINAGDGGANHPTQGLLDLFTIHKHFGKLSGLKGVFGGDPLNSRTMHSLLEGLTIYPGNKAYMLSPRQLRLETKYKNAMEKKGIKIYEIDNEKDIPVDADFWYWNRIQKERFVREEEYEKVKDQFVVTKDFLKKYGNNKMILMDPLPRVGEIIEEVDTDPRAVYFEQMRNGLFVRMALLSLIF